MTARPLATIVTAVTGVQGVPLAQLPDEPFVLKGVVAFGEVRDERGCESVLVALSRGVDVIVAVEVSAKQRAAFFDEISRIAEIRHGRAPMLTREERAVVAGLADGKTLTEVARALGMSRRTATRRLAAARLAFGVATTMELLLVVTDLYR